MEEEESKSASLNDNIDVEEEKQLHENDKSKINNKENYENYNNDNSGSNILSTEKEVASVLLRLIGSDSRDSSASLKECISDSTQSSKSVSIKEEENKSDSMLNILCKVVSMQSSSSNSTEGNTESTQEMDEIALSSINAISQGINPFPTVADDSKPNEDVFPKMFDNTSLSLDNIPYQNEVLIHPEFLLYLLKQADGERIQSLLDKPHIYLGSNADIPNTRPGINLSNLVPEGIRTCPRQLQIIYYLQQRLKSTNPTAVNTVIRAKRDRDKEEELVTRIRTKVSSQEASRYTTRNSEQSPNRIIISRNADDSFSIKENKQELNSIQSSVKLENVVEEKAEDKRSLVLTPDNISTALKI